jgi:outer membrane protein assembly factor BamB
MMRTALFARRRAGLSVVAAGLALVLTLGVGVARSSAAPAAVEADGGGCQFRAGPRHLGVYPGPAPTGIDGLVWKVALGGPLIASPTLCDGVIYLGAKDGGFRAIDPADGHQRWRFQADGPITASAAVAGGLAYFQSDAGTIHAVRVSDGRLAWKRATGPNLPFMNYKPGVDFWDYWASSPLYLDGVIYVGGGDGVVRALNARTGAVIWTHATGGRVRASPASDGARIYVGSFDGAMYALNRADGTLAWSFQTEGNSDFKVGAIQSSAAVAEGLVVFGSRDYRVYALDAATGKLAWIAPHEGSWVVGSPAIAGGKACVGSSDLKIAQCVDLKTGRELWRAPLNGAAFASPAVAGDALVVGTFGGTLYQLALGDGKTISGAGSDGRLLGTAWLEGGVAYVGAENGTLYAFGPEAK